MQNYLSVIQYNNKPRWPKVAEINNTLALNLLKRDSIEEN